MAQALLRSATMKVETAFFDALDGKTVRVSGHSWRMMLFGEYEGAGRRWVQLALRGSQDYSVTMSLDPDDDTSQVVVHIKRWLEKSYGADVILKAGRLSDPVDDAAPGKRRSLVRFRHDSAAHPAAVARAVLPDNGHVHRNVL
jgi:hypothetical protein